MREIAGFDQGLAASANNLLLQASFDCQLTGLN